MARPSAIVLEHCRNPRNAGALESPDAVGISDNSGRAPSIRVELAISDGIVREFAFSAKGCGYMVSAGSVLSTLSISFAASDLRLIDAVALEEAMGGVSNHKRHCPELAVQALHNALDDFESR